MSESRRQRAKELFHRALDRPAEEHDSFLKDACGDDPILEREVRSLLAAHHEAGGFLQSGLAIPALLDGDARRRDPLVGTSVGSYTILDLLGRGGMGAVYRAEQDNPRREVALKLVDRAIITPELLRRFEVEALVLAKLHHPGIAHIYEAGTTETNLGSRPYFAMELIEGLPIVAYADQRGLDRDERLELLIKVCDGVVRAVTDEEICDAKAVVGKYGLGCEPASAASIAGLKHLIAEGVVDPDCRVACVLTGHPLKDPNVTVNYHKDEQGPFSNPPIEAPNNLDEIIKLIQ